MEYTYVIHKAEEGCYWAEVPALPGCFTQGEALEEVVSNLREAIEAHVAALEQDGQDIPVESEMVVGRLAVGTR
jgi:predicted RNase H-like HicB family nuclease